MHTSPAPVEVVAPERPGYRPFRVSVARLRRLSPHFIRVTFRGEDLHHFGTGGLDQRIKLVLPVDGIPLYDLTAAAEASAETDADPEDAAEDAAASAGPMSWYEHWRALPDHLRTPLRTYTVRAVRPEAAEVDVDMLAHGDAGPASRWLAAAGIGGEAYLVGPDSRSPHNRMGIDWRPGAAGDLLLAGDETAAPAILSILETLPADSRGTALIEVPETADILEAAHPAGVDLRWLPRDGAAHGAPLLAAMEEWAGRHGDLLERARAPRPQELEEVNIDRDILWETPEALEARGFYAFLAGESGVIKALRRSLVTDRGVDRKRVAFMGYWRIGRAEG